MNATEHEPEPLPNTLRPLYEKVIIDIISRAEVGQERYGTFLQPFNGRVAEMDAYQEAIDLVMYQCQMLEERVWLCERILEAQEVLHRTSPIMTYDEYMEVKAIVDEIVERMCTKRK